VIGGPVHSLTGSWPRLRAEVQETSPIRDVVARPGMGRQQPLLA